MKSKCRYFRDTLALPNKFIRHSRKVIDNQIKFNTSREHYLTSNKKEGIEMNDPMLTVVLALILVTNIAILIMLAKMWHE
jgi:hypothetical protein